jgi:uncharacterized protein
MSPPDFESARRYALVRLERELSSQLTYHSIVHTRDEVAPAAVRLAALEGIDGERQLLLHTAAFYHDLGYIERRTDHEELSAQLAAEILPRFGYLPEHIAQIRGMIIATKLPQTPHTRLEEILADSDLVVFGQADFMPRNQDLRNELAAGGIIFTDAQWYGDQFSFIQRHRFFTASARLSYDAQKQQNIAALARRLSRLEA